jgi:hypothetical protein
MRTKFKGRLSLLFLALAMVLAVPATMAFADSLAIDGDKLDTSNSKNSKFVLCPGVGSSVTVTAKINYSGSGNGAKHFQNGSTVNITTSVPQAAQGFITANSGSVVVSDWNNNQDSVSTEMALSVDTDWVAGTYEVTYTAVGTDQNGDAYSLLDKNNVEIVEKTSGCSTGGGGGTDGGTTTPPPANTAPSVDVTGVVDATNYEIGSVPAAGCSVVDAEDTDESAAPVVNVISGPLSAYGLGSQTVTCSYTDAGGLSGADSVTYNIVDTGLPTISDQGATSTPNGSNGWYTSAVTNTFKATDTGAGFPTANPKLLQYTFTNSSGTSEGSAVKINSGSVSDVAGNAAAALDSAAFQIDLSNPGLNVSGPADGAVFNVCDSGLPNRPSFAPSDAISGLDGSQADSWTTPSNASGVGTYTYKADAKDKAGRTASETRTYTKTYGGAFGGVLQPINGGSTMNDLSDDNSRFKLGSTVPVKFKMMCGTTPVDNAVAKLNVKKADGTPDPGVDEAGSTAASTTGNLFRYDATNQQYIFNLSTKSGYTNPNGTTVSWAAGTYTLSVLMDDGSHRSVNINIVK